MNMLLDCKFYPKKLNFWLLEMKIRLIDWVFKITKANGTASFAFCVGEMSINGGERVKVEDTIIMMVRRLK